MSEDIIIRIDVFIEKHYVEEEIDEKGEGNELQK